MTKWAKTDAVAELIGMPESFVRQKAREGAFKSRKTGHKKQNHILVNLDSVEQWLESLPNAAEAVS